MPLPLYLLALAVFAMGTSEFMLAGLVPDIASSLDVSVAAAGLLTSAFAAGMIVGAPLMAALARRWPARAGRRMRGRRSAGALAARGPATPPAGLHARVHAPPAVPVGRPAVRQLGVRRSLAPAVARRARSG